MATAWTGHDDSLLRHFLGSEGRPLLAGRTPSTKDRFLQLSVRSHDPLEGQQRIALARSPCGAGMSAGCASPSSVGSASNLPKSLRGGHRIYDHTSRLGKPGDLIEWRPWAQSGP
jgi:hypothetical protein